MNSSDPPYASKIESKTIRKNLLRASLFNTAYELLQLSIIEGVDSFLAFDHEKDKWQKEYKKLCESRGLNSKKYRSPFYQACYWLIENNVITDDDLKKLDKIHDHRKDVVHRLPHFLIDPKYEVREDFLLSMREYIHRIDIWKAKNDVLIDVETGDIMPPPEKDSEIQSGRMIMLDHIISSVIDEL